ncbi:MAG: protein arginine kinase [Phycisphaeraceae bacterium]|nr:protein arginine kinase [Phycisphaeraceae bacterium]MCW5767333.1 protein arginine kinase [Phycisphaeraceae bacterium]
MSAGRGGEIPFHEANTEWLRATGQACDVVLSSRVRLARNLAGFPFMPKASRADRRQILDVCRRRVVEIPTQERIAWVDLHTASTEQRTILVERHLISKQHARGKLNSGQGGIEEPRGVAIAQQSEQLAIMVNEEDHLRIQSLRCGLSLTEALKLANEIDDALERSLDYAFDRRFGYLTACPTNVGTGIRFSVMLHLPGLRLRNELEKVKRAAAAMSLAVRGFYGEGSNAVGDLYQISNQTTLGKSEQMLLHELQNEIIPQVIEYERASRRMLVTRGGPVLRDRVHRALGILTHARLLAAEEAMDLLSTLRLGIVLGLVEGVPERIAHALLLLVQPGHLQRATGRPMDQEHRRGARADLVRAALAPYRT